MSELNTQMRKMQVSDYHGHGWVFRRAYKMDRKGQFLDKDDKVIPYDDPDLYEREGNPGKAVHLKDIHLERGCTALTATSRRTTTAPDKIYGDRRAVIEISCEDCHGTVNKKVTASTLRTSGFGAPEGGNSMLPTRNRPFNRARFIQRGGKLFQRSMVEQNDPATGKIKEWEVPQVADTIDPKSPNYNAEVRARQDHACATTRRGAPSPQTRSSSRTTTRRSRASRATLRGRRTAGAVTSRPRSTRASPLLHEEGDVTQVYPSYNPQVLRTDGYMLGIDGSVQDHKVMPVRSSSAVTVSVTNAARRVDRQPRADHLLGRLQRQRLQHAPAAHRPRGRDQAVHRLPRLQRERQQRVGRLRPDAGLESGQLHGALHLRRRGR